VAQPDSGRRDIERGDAVPAPGQLFGVVTEPAGHDESVRTRGGGRLGVQPGDERLARGQPGPRDPGQIAADAVVDLLERRGLDRSALTRGDAVDLGQVVRGRLPAAGPGVRRHLLG
jgi:hypothetical protein